MSVPPVGLVPTALAVTGAAAGPVGPAAAVLLLTGGGLLAGRRLRSRRTATRAER
ncbi:hypothetical protein [Rathayibacter sp. VKM Ac-2760]|uniref:hypothetical protein n=1 Tax=Rathayibacter sp. VKM Ac-2760 TaxID=2609253 RepID=UPI0013166E36|nr:hypothetical protein [Rathayibacter sp. VKM Ac-2760]QHC57712.1 hypothetical protein GSU72_03325 [Rathayibacter sp. VKM Ac-2760]